MIWHSTAAQFSHFWRRCGQQSISFIELLLSPSVSPTASTRYHVKLLWEQLKLCSIPLLLFLTSGDTVTVDLSSPIMEEVSHFSTPGCQPSFQSQDFLFETCHTQRNQIMTYWTAPLSNSGFFDNTADNFPNLVWCIFIYCSWLLSSIVEKKKGGHSKGWSGVTMYRNYCTFLRFMAVYYNFLTSAINRGGYSLQMFTWRGHIYTYIVNEWLRRWSTHVL